jgi:two-component system, chemotaxis family, protein-glutamate methylesterase/glutaminase
VVEWDLQWRHGLMHGLGQNPGIAVVGAAATGKAAIDKVALWRPDCVIVDFDSGAAEALELLASLQQAGNTMQRIVVASPAIAATVMHKAVQLGAGSVVQRPVGKVTSAAVAELTRDVLAPILRHAKTNTRAPTPAPSAASLLLAPSSLAGPSLPAGPRPSVVGIGVSTGGPKALTSMLPQLPADFPLPILIVQHMPPKFTLSLAESLDRVCRLRVREAKDGDRVEPGRILIAPGGWHMRTALGSPGEVVRLTEDPPECSCRPSVDYLFRSLADVYGGRVLGVVMTGMGEDGWLGSRAIHAAGGRILAQDQASSTVFGMPRGPIEARIGTAVGLDQMADAIVHAVRGAVPAA